MALGAACLAGCGHHAAPTATPTPIPTEPGTSRPSTTEADALARLLTIRAAALQRGDAAAYAATATGAQRRRDLLAARRARGLPLRDVAMIAERFGIAGDEARLRVRTNYGVRGIAWRFDSTLELTARRTRAGWRIVRRRGNRGRPPWELARFATRRTRHFLVLTAATATGLDETLESGYRHLRAVLRSGGLRPRYLVVVAADGAMARALTHRIRGVATLSAISDTQVREEGPARRVTAVVSQRLLVVWPRFAALGGDERERVVEHELTHAALARSTSGRTPAWLLEGIALWTSGDRRADQAAGLLAGRRLAGTSAAQAGAARRALSLKALNRPGGIARLSGVAQGAAYAYSSAAAFYVAERYGARRLLALYAAFNDPAIPGRASLAVTDRAVRRTLHVSLARLDRDVRARLTR